MSSLGLTGSKSKAFMHQLGVSEEHIRKVVLEDNSNEDSSTVITDKSDPESVTDFPSTR